PLDKPMRSIASGVSPSHSGPVLIASAVAANEAFLQPAALRGAGGSDETHKSPKNEIVEEVRPRFRWETYRNAVRYEIHLLAMSRKDGSLKELFNTAVKAPRTEWRPPQSLSRGQNYVWYVEAYNAEGNRINARGEENKDPADTQVFSVLDA